MIRRRYPIKRSFRRRYPGKGNLILSFIKTYFIIFVLITVLVVVLNIIFKDRTPQEQRVVLKGIKRSEAYKRGMDMINYVWEFNFERNGIENDKDVELPYFLQDKKDEKICGIPYCWGGYISLDISNQKDVKNFAEAVEKGYTTGNVLTEGGYKAFTVGLDCSGFVSAVFKLPEKCGTKTLEKYFDEIDMKDLKPMDILNSKNHHVVIFLRETADKKGIIVMEETTGTTAIKTDRTLISYRSWDEVKKGMDGDPFVPMRYKKIVDDDIPMFKDQYEYNDYPFRAYKIQSDKIYKGYINYAQDVDYFSFNIDKKGNYVFSLFDIPESAIVEVMDGKNNMLLRAQNRGSYPLSLDKGNYYVKIYGEEFKYNNEKEYSFSIGI